MAKKTDARPDSTGAARSGTRQYWLFKSEPEAFSITHLGQQRNQTTFWDGVRNYQARNYLRDTIQMGDGVLFYHSNSEPLAIMGTAKVVKTGYPDPTAFDPASDHYDPESDAENPTWYMVNIQLVQVFPEPLTRQQLLEEESLSDMVLLQKGSRLSIQPVTLDEWQKIHALAGAPTRL